MFFFHQLLFEDYTVNSRDSLEEVWVDSSVTCSYQEGHDKVKCLVTFSKKQKLLPPPYIKKICANETCKYLASVFVHQSISYLQEIYLLPLSHVNMSIFDPDAKGSKICGPITISFPVHADPFRTNK